MQTITSEETMRFGIPLLADRVAPRCTFADCVLVVRVKGRRIRGESEVPLNGNTWADLVGALSDQGVDTLICGGIAPATRESIRSRDMEVIENVAGTRDEVLRALSEGRIHPGFGLEPEPESAWKSGRAKGIGGGAEERKSAGTRSGGAGRYPETPRFAGEHGNPGEVRWETEEFDSPNPTGPNDCLECTSRVCLQGEACPFLDLPLSSIPNPETRRILESTWDVALEEERTLCRLAELVYFGLEMGYQRLGVAFCEDLREPATILTRVLRRFFEVVPVGCKVHREDSGDGPDLDGIAARRHYGSGAPVRQHYGSEVPCDPQAVADILNLRNTDLNVLVGFCVGADSVFTKGSQAPVTTIFVKDKSLANNPIGAVYSHYYLTDI